MSKKTSNRENLEAYDLKRSLFTAHSIVRDKNFTFSLYFHSFEKIGRYWYVGLNKVDDNGEREGHVKMREIEKMILSGDLVVSVKDMTRPCDTDEPAHPDAGKIVIVS